MKSSEALLRAIAAAGGRIPAEQFDIWLGKLVEAELVEKETHDDKFYYELTEKAKELLRKKEK